MGLSIARWIASTHNGSITATNNPQNGATNKVKLPK
ncbi:hypothetical protein V6B33_17200 [Mangrovibacillus sp. Mu-81]